MMIVTPRRERAYVFASRLRGRRRRRTSAQPSDIKNTHAHRGKLPRIGASRSPATRARPVARVGRSARSFVQAFLHASGVVRDFGEGSSVERVRRIDLARTPLRFTISQERSVMSQYAVDVTSRVHAASRVSQVTLGFASSSVAPARGDGAKTWHNGTFELTPSLHATSRVERVDPTRAASSLFPTARRRRGAT